MPAGPHRPIDNVHDVRAIFDSGRASFHEYMDCVEVAKHAGDWQLRHQAAELATAEALGWRRSRPPNLLEAAQQVVNSFLSRATNIEELERHVFATRQWFTERDHQFRGQRDDRNRSIDRFLSLVHDENDPSTEDDRQSLYRLLLLANAPEAEYRVMLSSTLRRPFDRPDLAIDAATRALDQEPKNIAALTTRGAARVDEGELAGAETDLDAALAIDGDSRYALVARSRCHLHCGEATEALEVAQRARVLYPTNEFAFHSVLSAAVAADRLDIYRQVLEEFSSLEPEDRATGLYIKVLAIEAILEGGRLDQAEAALKTLENENPRGLPAARVRKLRREIRNQQRRRQGRLDL